MRAQPFQVLQGGLRPVAREERGPVLVIAGATGVLGNEVMRRLVGLQGFMGTHVLAREPIKAGWRSVTATVVDGDAPGRWPVVRADTAIVLFDPPRLFYDRERALWTPRPEQLPQLALWLRSGGVRTLAVVLPHAQFHLPEALKRGLAGLDEQSVAALGFERLVIVRSAQAPAAPAGANLPMRLARSMLSVFKYMVPGSEQPVRAVKVAQFVALALQLAPPGIHVAAPETVWRAAQGDMRSAVIEWLAA
jgi:hypothetical protein